MKPDKVRRSDGEGADLGIVGLGVMGRHLLVDLSDAGFRVAGFDTNREKVAALDAEARGGAVVPVPWLSQLVSSLRRPRAVLLLVPTGAVDAVLDELVPQLGHGDVVIDAGNSHFTDTDRRGKALAAHGVNFLGLGISGGESGVRHHGASLMAGGPREAFDRVRPMLEAVAARVKGDPCFALLGSGAAGHYVKMVHNGIEYGLMQLIAETYELASRALKIPAPQVGKIFESWNETEVGGFLVEITARVLTRIDEMTGQPLIDQIRDIARQKGTGRWTSQEALALGMPTPTIDAAVVLRNLSALPNREEIRTELSYPATSRSAQEEVDPEALRRALYAGMILTYAQGFSLLSAGSSAHGYELRLDEVARIWRGGCIIRARLLDTIWEAYRAHEPPPSLVTDPALASELQANHAALKDVAALAVRLEVPAPATMASLAYLESLRDASLPANLIQAQRDYFGGHTYERVDAAGAFHTEWMPS